ISPRQPSGKNIIRWLLKKRTNGSVRYCQYTSDWLCRGNPETQKAIWFNLQNGVLIGAVTLNQGREIRPIRKWIQSGKTFDAKLLIDENIALKSL
ncbi:oxidoreductase C-terminal domain-containing protein, partial [Shigella boydii]